MPIVRASEKKCSAGPPKKNIESVIAKVDVWVMTVREIVAVMAELIISSEVLTHAVENNHGFIDRVPENGQHSCQNRQ